MNQFAFIKLIEQIKELSFSDKIFLFLSFRSLNKNEQESLFESLKFDPSLLKELIHSYLAKKEFILREDDKRLEEYNRREEKIIMSLIRDFIRNRDQEEIKKIKSKI